VTHPDPEISNLTAFYTEMLATGMALLCVYAIADQRNRSGTPVALGMSFRHEHGLRDEPGARLRP
jgi:hypothetical protein